MTKAEKQVALFYQKAARLGAVYVRIRRDGKLTRERRSKSVPKSWRPKVKLVAGEGA